MKWIEIITLRSSEKHLNPIVLEHIKEAVRATDSNSPFHIATYHDAAVETDLSIHFHWESEHEYP